MFKVEWDKESGGVLLSSKVTENTLGISPRPVFYEELDLLRLDKKGWDYPHSTTPIMWAINKQYWYRGTMLFEAKGASIYDLPTIEYAKGVEPQKLLPIDLRLMLEKNADQMFLIESEAVEFIREQYVTYAGVNRAYKAIHSNQDVDYEELAAKIEKKVKKKMAVVKQDCDSFDIVPLNYANHNGKRVLYATHIDKFIVSFSGGKDSQVVLDLCTRAIPPYEFEVIYSDTGYELPPSLKLYEELQNYYKERFPSLQFSIARNHESVLNYWDKIGIPSDTHRWCCSVMKTAPLYRCLKIEGNKQARVLAFEGVRTEESSRRSGYSRIGKGVKHSFVVNARPIFGWNTTEVFLYLFSHNMPINEAYRIGKPRVGCILCPFGSPWDDMIVERTYSKELSPFLSRIEKIVDERKIPNSTEYIKERLWKLRSSGTNTGNKTIVKVIPTANSIEINVDNPQNSVLLWLPTIGDIVIQRTAAGGGIGILTFEKEKYNFEFKESAKNIILTVVDGNNVRLRYFLKRIVYKDAYCINCESCEVECPTGALSVYPKIEIDTKKCIHCMKCVDYHQYGCIVADSLVTTMNNTNSTNVISRYGTFGIQEAWAEEFLAEPNRFWERNTLGVKQIPSFKAWLRDAEIIDERNRLTQLGDFCHRKKDTDHNLIWEIVYINLCYNNSLMRWYAQKVPFGKPFTRKEIEAQIHEYYDGQFAKSSISYALQALLQVFKYSPIGTELRQLEVIDPKGPTYKRNVYEGISKAGTAYSIFKYAKFHDLWMFRVSDLYRTEENNGIHREFGIERNEFLQKLRSISIAPTRVLTAELNMGLDHITLNKDVSPIDVLEIMSK